MLAGTAGMSGSTDGTWGFAGSRPLNVRNIMNEANGRIFVKSA